MKFVHHDTGEWVRNDANTQATRTAASVQEYDSLDAIKNQWLRDTFAWMVQEGLHVTQCGSSTMQIRDLNTGE